MTCETDEGSRFPELRVALFPPVSPVSLTYTYEVWHDHRLSTRVEGAGHPGDVDQGLHGNGSKFQVEVRL